ncbi:polysaccharide biosynthesis/export family protein [Desulfuromonas versatilis]|uniref:polysaccharide biosynthesis/export family protein n=1 Tax=Desulfuromonas versatilis TaxID=2802975 RepID=UPI001C85AA75|nr:polysaccharide biosynthesis/export family protein [Desulfuromonas versatilis]
MLHARHRLLALALFLTLGQLFGCSSYVDLPAGTVKEVVDSPVVEQEAVEVAPLRRETEGSREYRVGPGDSLFINVNGRAELGSPQLTGNTKVVGSRVDGNGNIRLPLVGTVPVAGLTLSEIQTNLEQVFALYLNDPWVVVEVAEFKSQGVNLLGQFRVPGTYYMDRSYSLLEGLALGGGLLDTANLRSARLIRGQQTLPVDIYHLLRDGAGEQNVLLQAGDTIFVPDDRNQNVFVFGAVKKTGPVPMPNGQLNLVQALASAGLDETGGNQRFVRIIRSLSATRGQLLVLDLKKTLEGDSLPFPLVEGDIVYLPRSAVGNWNQAIQEILPSLQAISAVLQPFVQIKFLTEE